MMMELTVQMAVGCPNGCSIGDEEKWVKVEVSDDGSSYYSTECEGCGATWEAGQDVEITANVLASTLSYYQSNKVLVECTPADIMSAAAYMYDYSMSYDEAMKYINSHQMDLTLQMDDLCQNAVYEFVEVHPPDGFLHPDEEIVEDLPDDDLDWK